MICINYAGCPVDKTKVNHIVQQVPEATNIATASLLRSGSDDLGVDVTSMPLCDSTALCRQQLPAKATSSGVACVLQEVVLLHVIMLAQGDLACD